MVNRSGIDSLDTPGVLSAVVDARRAADRAEADLLVLAAHFADLHPVVDGAAAAGHGDPGLAGMGPVAGRERLQLLGGVGTPAVAEFAVDELAAALGVSIGQAKALVGEALELRHRLPRLWELVLRGLLQAWKARQVARETIELSPAAAAFVDRHVAVVAARNRLPYLGRLVQEATARCDPEHAAEREQRERDRRGVWINHRGQAATATITAVVDAIDGVAFDARVGQVAATLAELGDTSAEQVRRARAVGIVANPQRALWLTGTDPAAQASALAADSRLVGLLEHPLFADLDPATILDAQGRLTGAGLAEHATRSTSRPAAHGGRAAGVGAMVYLHLEPHAVLTLVRTLTGTTHDTTADTAAADTSDTSDTSDASDAGAAVAVEERYGAITLALLREWLGAVDQITLRPVLHLTDPAAGGAAGMGPGTKATVAYAPPESMAELVRLRDQRCVFPDCQNPARAADLDHITNHDPHADPDAWNRCRAETRGTGASDGDEAVPVPVTGLTHPDNLAPLCRHHHRVKTHSGWRYQRLPDGSYHWTGPHAQTYLVTPGRHGGTRHPDTDSAPHADTDAGPPGTGHPPGGTAPPPGPGPRDATGPREPTGPPIGTGPPETLLDLCATEPHARPSNETDREDRGDHAA